MLQYPFFLIDGKTLLVTQCLNSMAVGCFEESISE